MLAVYYRSLTVKAQMDVCLGMREVLVVDTENLADKMT